MSDADSTETGLADEEGTSIGAVDDQTLNRVFDLLRDQRRRYVLEKLRASSDGATSTEELVNHVLAHDPEATDRDRVAVRLHHNVLPRLAEAGVVDFDRRSDTVRYRGDELVEALLGFVAHAGDSP